MKKNKVVIIILVVLTFIAAYFVISNNSGTLKKEQKDFAVQDTSSITKIFLANNEGNKILLERNNYDWTVNGKYPARQDAINTLLKTVKDLEVKSPVAKTALKTIIGQIAVRSTKVEIYTKNKNKPEKVYYVGGPTPDNFGTFMVMENSSAPFIMHLPGLHGYLTTRYFTDEWGWRSTALYRYKPSEIDAVEIVYHTKPEYSFKIENILSGELKLTNPSNGESYTNVNQIAVKNYLNGFSNINFEFYADDVRHDYRDSLATHCKFFDITITDKEGKKNVLNAYQIPVTEGNTENPFDGSTIEYDVDRMYAHINNKDGYVVIQYFVFDDITAPLKFFLKE
jgi:hypothetical protein